jgi:hypothetical protein
VAQEQTEQLTPDARLDPYRHGVAVVLDDEVVVGHLFHRVQVWWTVKGRVWPRRRVDPVERLEWFLAWSDQGRTTLEGTSHSEELDLLLTEFAAGELQLRGKTFQLRWLRGAEADQAWQWGNPFG